MDEEDDYHRPDDDYSGTDDQSDDHYEPPPSDEGFTPDPGTRDSPHLCMHPHASRIRARATMGVHTHRMAVHMGRRLAEAAWGDW